MSTQKFSRRVLATFLIFCNFIFVASVKAEVKIYTGVGVHYIENEDETLAQAKDAAKLAAELDAMEQAQVNVQGYSEMHNFNLTRDEVISITAGIMNVTNVKYSIQEEMGVLVINAEVTAEIDTDKIAEMVEREIKFRSND